MTADMKKYCQSEMCDTIHKHQLLVPGDSVLIAVSGGSDSMALLHLLYNTADQFSLRLGIAHLNHGLRGTAADRDQNFVKRSAAELNIPFHIKRVDLTAASRPKRSSLEACARRERYTFFKELCRQHGYTKVATGHHQEDNAEWILLNLIRGCGLAGICGIPYKRPLIKGRAWVVRPLLTHTPDMLKIFLKETRQPFMTDATNHQTRFLRNRIRHDLLPHLKKNYNRNVTKALCRLSRIAARENEALKTLAEKTFQQVIIDKTDHTRTIDLAGWQKLSPGIRQRILKSALMGLCDSSLRFQYRHFKALERLAAAPQIGSEIDLPGRIQASRTARGLHLRRHATSLRILPNHHRKWPQPYVVEITGPGRWDLKVLSAILTLTETRVPSHKVLQQPGQHVAFFDMDLLQFPLVLRNIETGDRFQPLGMTGSKKVMRYLMDRKVPADNRRKTAVLLSGDTIIWVVGHGLSHQTRIKRGTQLALKAEIGLLKQQI